MSDNQGYEIPDKIGDDVYCTIVDDINKNSMKKPQLPIEDHPTPAVVSRKTYMYTVIALVAMILVTMVIAAIALSRSFDQNKNTNAQFPSSMNSDLVTTTASTPQHPLLDGSTGHELPASGSIQYSRISVGPIGVMLLSGDANTNGVIYYLEHSSNLVQLADITAEMLHDPRWFKDVGNVNYITVGKNLIVGFQLDEDIWTQGKPKDTSWVKRLGSAVKGEASDSLNQIWVVQQDGDLYYKQFTKINDSSPWFLQHGNIDTVGISKYGIWVTMTYGDINFRLHNKTTQESNIYSPGWVKVDAELEGSLEQVSADEDLVVCVTDSGLLYVRQGMTASQPMGTSWHKISYQPGNVRQISLHNNYIWLTTEDNKIIVIKIQSS